ncbi:MAG: hypothetical protein ACPLSP_01805 [Fervidicoccus fontis]
MRYYKCGFKHDRDVIGAINIVKRFLLGMSPVPLGSKGAHDPHVEWLVATVNHGFEAQPAIGKPIAI